MTGFAFTTLVFLLAPIRPDESSTMKQRRHQVSSVAFVSFALFALSTLGYSAAGGETSVTTRAMSETILADVGLFMAIMHSLLGIVLLLDHLEIRHAATLAKVFAVVALPALGYAYIRQDMINLEGRFLEALAASISIFVCIAAIAIFVVKKLPASHTGWISKFLNPAALGFVCVTTIVLGLTQGQEETFAISGEVVALILLLLALILGLYAVVILSSGSAPAGSAPAGSAPAGSAPAGSAPAGSAPAGSAP
jgi:hypothetical protein